MKKKISAILAVSMIATNASPLLNVYASEVVKEKAKFIEEKVISEAKVKNFDLKNYSNFEGYNSEYRVLREQIKSISNNGGNYASSSIDKAIDGNLSTHWETGKSNSTDFKNEVVVEFNNVETIDRIAYATRQDTAKGKGFPTQFEVYSSLSGNDEDFKLVSQGSHTSTGNMMEFKFDTINTKKVKFVFKEANQGWASASEFWFYREDLQLDKMNKIFTDDSRTTLSEEFNSLDKLSKFEEEVKSHPFYESIAQDLNDAKLILEGNTVVYKDAIVSKFKKLGSDDLVKYDELFKVQPNKISTNGGHYGSSNIEKAIDGKADTSWHSGKQNTKDFTNEVILTLDEITTIDRIVYTAGAGTHRGFAESFDIYASKTTKGDSFELVSKGSCSRTNDSIEIKFNPTQFKRVKFVFKKGYENWALASEFGLYKVDTVNESFDKIFTNGLMDELKESYDTIQELTALESEAKNHPFYKDYKDILDRAKKVLNDKDAVKSERLVVGEQRGHYTTESGKRMINGAAYSSFESFGKYVTAGEEIVVYVDADPNGKLPQLCYGQVGKGQGDWRRWADLKPGKNVLKVPENINPSALYLVNQARPEDQAFAPRVRIEGGTKFPTYFHGETDPKEYRRDLEEYAKKLELSDKEFANGNPKGKVFNIAEFVSENVVITTSALGAIEGLKWAEKQNLDISDTMTEWEKMHEFFQTFMGYEKDTEDEKNSYFPNKFIARVFYGVPLGFADHGYTGYLGSDNVERNGGFFKLIAAPPNMKGNDNWAYTHEFGHIFNTKHIVDGEVTNNLYAQEYRRINSDKVPNNDRAAWNEIMKRFQGEEHAMHYFERLAVLSQLNIAYGYDAYAKASRAVRDNTELIKSIKGSDVQRLAVAYSLGLGVDLLDFFDGWNYANIEITEQMKDVVKHLPKPGKKLEYLHSGAYDYKGEGFTENIKVNVNSNIDKENKTVTLNFNVDKENQDDVLGYEILKDGKFVGYTKTSKFIIKDVDVDKNQQYQVVAYAKDLSTAEAVNVQILKPTLSIEENVTLALGTKFDANKFVKALDYEGNVLEDIKIKSNVDTSNKGNYEVTYTVVDNDIEISKVMKVNVVSKIIYASDVEEASSKVGWGEFRKDKAPNNTKIELDRQGVVAGYDKGLGAHADSEVIYNIEGKGYEKFESYIGIDQSMRDNSSSSASFKIYLDGKEVYSSARFASNTNHEFVSIDLGNAKELKLVTEDHGNNSADQTVWADAKFTNNNTKPTITLDEELTTVKLNSEFDLSEGVEAKDIEDGNLSDIIEIKDNGFTTTKVGKYTIEYSVTDSDKNTVTKSKEILVYSDISYVSDNKYTIQKSGWGGIRNDKAPAGNEISVLVNGEETIFKKGIGAHANSEITFDLTGKEYEYFTSVIGIDANVRGNANASAKYKVLVDGNKVFESKIFKSNDDSQVITIPVNGAKEIKLITDQANQNDWSDQTVWADAKFLVTNSKPSIVTEDITIEVGTNVDMNQNVTASDAEDGDLTSKIEIVSNNFKENTIGRFEVVYKVTDSDGNVSEKTRYITAYETFNVKKSKYGSFTNLDSYNEEYKIPVVSAKNNAGNYGSDVIARSIDNNLNTHWETNSPNNNKFKNEVVFDLGESKEINRMSYVARKGGKGFATSFSVYTSNKSEGNDFILAGKGAYSGNTNDVIEFKLNKTEAKRVKFVFDTARENWASIGEISFYTEDKLADKVESLFTDSNKTEVVEEYNTLDKLNALKEEVKNHQANELFQEDFNKAEELIKSSFPTLNIPKSQSVKLGQTIDDLVGEVSASDTKDGDLSSSIKVSGIENVNFKKTGEYELTYSVTDSDENSVSKTRKISVVNMNDFTYLTTYDWKFANTGWGSVTKDNSVSKNGLRLTGENGEEISFEKGIGTHSTSTITYDLNDKNYERFSSYVGVDRAMYGSAGSVQFEVYVDGEKAFDSGVMNSKDKMQFIDVDIADAKELKLVVKDGGNGNGSDHANWANAKLHFVNEEVVNYEQLINLVNSTKNLNDYMYTIDSYNALEESVNKANEVIENANSGQIEVDELVNELQNSINNLVERQDKKQLQELVNYAETIEESMVGAQQFAQQRWENFLEYKEVAKEELLDKNKTEEEINVAIFTLNYFIDELELR